LCEDEIEICVGKEKRVSSIKIKCRGADSRIKYVQGSMAGESVVTKG